MDMNAVIARIKRAGGQTRIVQDGSNCKIEAKFSDGWQPILENVSRPVAEAVLKQAGETKQVIID